MKQEFSIDDVVELVESPGTRFKISQIWKLEVDGSYRYSAEGRPYFPANALRLVDSPKVGDWVEVISGGPLNGRIYQVSETIDPCGQIMAGGINFNPGSLRKLSSAEIEKWLQKRIAALETRIENTNIACHEEVHKTITGKIRSIESRQDDLVKWVRALNDLVVGEE